VANDLVASMVLAIWLYLLAGRGGFWLAADRDDDGASSHDAPWDGPRPAITAIIPARDEAACVGETVASLLRQDYAGELRVVLVDDQSRDATAQVARDAAVSLGKMDRLTVLSGNALPAGWTGKLWAQQQGVALVDEMPNPPAYLLFTDADIVYGPDALSHLVAQAQPKALVLASLMVKLRCESFAERIFIPAFIFFFQMLYPFAWANDPRRATAAAAGGCMLVRRDALHAAGGLAAIRGSLIDDCALAKLLKAHGPIWIGLTERVRSIRAYPAVADIRRMVSRTAYAQLRYSPLLLAGTIVGLALTYLAPVALTFFVGGVAQFLGIFVWASMALAFRPTLHFYGLSALWGLALPAIAAIYMAFTLDSAYQHARGRGGMWKGRAQANVSEIAMSDTGKSDAGNWRSGKGHRDENFPVASWLIRARHRPPILAFYNFVRTADDIADHPTLQPEEKLALLDRLDGGLTGKNDEDAVAARLRGELAEHNLSAKHAQDLLAAFKLDVTKLRYRDWDDLISYCSLSAMPVGRFVCDVHGESRSVWPANDALCAALQIINHLQDCRADYLDLNRVYVPLDALAATGATVEELGGSQASAALLACLHALAARTEQLLSESDVFSLLINDLRLGLEVSVINTLAHRLTRMLMTRDPLADPVHLKIPAVAGLTMVGIFAGASRRLGRRLSATAEKPRGA
jgi:squalene synthase HpnC